MNTKSKKILLYSGITVVVVTSIILCICLIGGKATTQTPSSTTINYPGKFITRRNRQISVDDNGNRIFKEYDQIGSSFLKDFDVKPIYDLDKKIMKINGVEFRMKEDKRPSDYGEKSKMTNYDILGFLKFKVADRQRELSKIQGNKSDIIQFNIFCLNFFYEEYPHPNLDLYLWEFLDYDCRDCYVIWEKAHDYIQYLFPLNEKSSAEPNSILLKNSYHYLYKLNENNNRFEIIMTKLICNYVKFLYDVVYFKHIVLDCSYDHNFKRISRILKSLNSFGFHKLAKGFYKHIEATLMKGKANSESKGIWQKVSNYRKAKFFKDQNVNNQ